MAYSTISVTIAGESLDAIDVSGDGVQVILEEALTNYDKEVMNAISDEAGATFADKMAAYTHPNGVTGDVLYADFVVTTADYDTLRARSKSNSTRIDALEVTVADHEDRITTLEP